MPAESQLGSAYDAAFVAALFDGVDVADPMKAILPPGSRSIAVNLLTRVMASVELRSVYCSALETERARRGSAVEMRLLGYSGLDLREEEIAARGFSGLTDDELADIARSPEAIEALADFVEDPDTELGVWYVEALIRDVAENPRSPDDVRRTKELLHAKLASHDPALASAIDTPDNSASVINIRETLTVVCAELLSGDLSSEISPRTLVDETHRRIHRLETPAPASDHQFYELAAFELRRLIVDRARRALKADEQVRSKETVSGSAASAMTLPMADQAPEHVLKMDQRLDELAQIDEELVRVFSLSEFAGRSSDEIAGLVGSSPGEVTAAVEAARTELSLIE